MSLLYHQCERRRVLAVYVQNSGVKVYPYRTPQLAAAPNTPGRQDLLTIFRTVSHMSHRRKASLWYAIGYGVEGDQVCRTSCHKVDTIGECPEE